MEEVEFSLVKKKIIKMNDVMKILADKNYNINRLMDKLKIIYFKYREKSNEVYTLRPTLEALKLELEPLRIDYKNLLSKYGALEVEHNNFVNNSEMKYQKVCAELNDVLKRHANTVSNLPEHCKSCKSQAEKIVAQSKEIKLLNTQLENLKNMQNDKPKVTQITTSYVNSLKENHLTELKAVNEQHAMELRKIESKYIQELDILNGKLTYLESREAALNDKINVLKEHLNKQVQKPITLMKTDCQPPSPFREDLPHMDEDNLQSDCSDYEDEIINKCVLECKYVPTLLSPIDGEKLLLERPSSELEATTETGQIENKHISIPDIPDHNTDFAVVNRVDIDIDDVVLTCPDEELGTGSKIMETENNIYSVDDPASVQSSIPDIETRLLTRNAFRAKQVRYRRLKQNLLKTLFKYIDDKLTHSKSYSLKVYDHKQSNPQSYRNKRKAQMMKWKYLREVCFSSTDSEHDNRIVRYKERPRRRKNKQSERENVFKIIREVNENYGNLKSGFDDLSKYYHSLNLDSGQHGENNTPRMDSSVDIDSDVNLQIDSPDSGYSGKSDTDNSNVLIKESTYSNNTPAAKLATNDVTECSKNVSSQCADTVTKFNVDNMNISLEKEYDKESSHTTRDNSCNTNKPEGPTNDLSSEIIVSDVVLNHNDKKVAKKNDLEESNHLNNLNCLTNLLEDSTADVSTKYKKRISHYNTSKSPEAKRQKLHKSCNDNTDSLNSLCEQNTNNYEEAKKIQHNSSTNLLQESSVQDAPYKHCRKKRISHYNKIKCKDVKVDESPVYKEINTRTNISIESSEIETCKKTDAKAISHVPNEKKYEGHPNNNTSSSVCPEILKRIPNHSNAVYLKKFITFPDEGTIFADVVSVFSTQDSNTVIRCVLQEVSLDTNTKPDNNFTPPAPILTETQRALLALLTKLQTTSFPHLLDEFLSASEKFILQECNLQNIQPVTRLYLAVCKLTRNLDRMRRMACDVLYFLGDLSIPFLFTVLSTWIEVLPLDRDSHDNPLVKVLVQVVNLKTCVNSGYNLLPLKKLLEGYFGYPTERWNSNDVFKDVFSKFLVTPTKLLEYCLLILCKNHPGKWTTAQIDVHIKPILQSHSINVTSRNLIESLLRNIIAGVEDDIPDCIAIYNT